MRGRLRGTPPPEGAARPDRSFRSRVERRHVDLLRVNSALCPAHTLPVH